LLLAAAIAGCGATATAGADTRAELTQLIRVSLDHHRGYHVQSLSCPKVRLAKDLVIICGVTIRGGHKLRMRATELDNHGSYHLVASEMLADNVEHGIVTTRASRDPGAIAHCPAHVPVLVGRSFDCGVTDHQGRHLTAVVAIGDRDGGFVVDIK
jgi:hypothetical protein